MTTHTTTTTSSNDLSKYEIDKLIKKFNYSIKQQQQQRNKLDSDEFFNNNFKKSNKKEFNNEEVSLNNNKNNLYFSYTPLSNHQLNNNNNNNSSAAVLLNHHSSNTNIKSQILKKNKSNFNLNSTIANISTNLNSKENDSLKRGEEQEESSTLSSYLTNTNNSHSNDKAAFFTTLKSLFAIFDPECKGTIDINELNQLGASKNEILNDVICYLYRKNLNKDSKIALQELVATNELNYNSSSNNINNNLSSISSNSSSTNTNNNNNNHNTNNSSSNCSSSRSSSANSNSFRANNHNNNNNNNNTIKPIYIDDSSEQNSNNNIITSSRLTFIKNNLKINTNNNNNRREFRSPSANQIRKQQQQQNNTNKKLKQNNYQTNNPYYVSFDQFAQAAEIILDKRKLEKLKMYQQQQQINNNNKRSNVDLDYSNLVTVQPPPPIIQSNRITNLNYSNRPNSLSNNYIASNPANYTSLPIVNNSSTKPTHLNGATLSQAFENVTNNLDNKSKPITNIVVKQQQPTELLKNANSCDINNLIEKEHQLLKQGLNDIDQIKYFYLNQLKENKLKQQNVHKLKHQNLYSIDKMLTDLKQLNDFNSQMANFLLNNQTNDLETSENIDADLSTTTSSSSASQKENFFMNQQLLADAAKAAAAAISTSPTTNQLPTYKDYLEQFDLTKNDLELDNYLKEKQSRIDSLQKEKSYLIRRLFEMKSEAASLTKQNPMLHLSNPNRVVNYEKLPLNSIHQPSQHQMYQPGSSNDLIYRNLK